MAIIIIVGPPFPIRLVVIFDVGSVPWPVHRQVTRLFVSIGIYCAEARLVEWNHPVKFSRSSGSSGHRRYRGKRVLSGQRYMGRPLRHHIRGSSRRKRRGRHLRGGRVGYVRSEASGGKSLKVGVTVNQCTRAGRRIKVSKCVVGAKCRRSRCSERQRRSRF